MTTEITSLRWALIKRERHTHTLRTLAVNPFDINLPVTYVMVQGKRAFYLRLPFLQRPNVSNRSPDPNPNPGTTPRFVSKSHHSGPSGLVPVHCFYLLMYSLLLDNQTPAPTHPNLNQFRTVRPVPVFHISLFPPEQPFRPSVKTGVCYPAILDNTCGVELYVYV